MLCVLINDKFFTLRIIKTLQVFISKYKHNRLHTNTTSMSISNTREEQGQKATPLLPSKFGRYTSPHVYKYTFIIKLLAQFHFLDLFVPHWWDVALASSIDSEPDLKMGTFVLQALLVDEIRERAKAFEPKSFNDNFNWPFIFHSALKATISFLFSPVNPAAHSHLMSLSYMCDVPP